MGEGSFQRVQRSGNVGEKVAIVLLKNILRLDFLILFQR